MLLQDGLVRRSFRIHDGQRSHSWKIKTQQQDQASGNLTCEGGKTECAYGRV